MIRFFKVCLVVGFALFQRLWGYETGAPGKACETMLPGHMSFQTRQPVQAQRGQAPFLITVNQSDYAPHEPIKVRLEGQQSFQGFMMQGRNRQNMVLGGFSVSPPGTRTLECNGVRDSLTHDSSLPKHVIDVMWFPPNVESGPIAIVATVATNHDVFWSGVVSRSMVPNREKYIVNPPHDPYYRSGKEYCSGSKILITSVTLLVAVLNRLSSGLF